MKKRTQLDANTSNYSAAVLCDLDQAKAEKRSSLKVQKWLPYDLGGGSDPVVGDDIRELISKAHGLNLLPPKMQRDLMKMKLLDPG